MPDEGDLKFFENPEQFRKWLERHHATARELWVGYYKKASGKPSLTWPESVDEALCHGWIDGLRRSIDDTSYKIRFTPRKPTSTWSSFNTKRAQELIANGRMQPAGLKALEARKENNSGVYSFEQEHAHFDAAAEKQFKANKAAWAFFQKQPPWYRKAATWLVISAKREETRAKRLQQLIDDSAAGHTIAPLTRKPRTG
jgi:uncharacterized protein YdeI (YjbR/CyaY-like superfamily)